MVINLLFGDRKVNFCEDFHNLLRHLKTASDTGFGLKMPFYLLQ